MNEIVFAVNDRFLPLTTVAINSLLQNLDQQQTYRVTILHTGIAPKRQAKVSAMATPWLSVRFVDVRPLMSQWSLVNRGYLTTETYFRILIPEIFPDAGNVLYLDSDLVTVADVSPLFALALGDHLVAAVPEWWGVETLQLSKGEYFNAGVLLFNVPAWRREHQLSQQCLNFAQRYPHLANLDQDVLNLFCAGRWHELPMGYNLTTGDRRRPALYQEKPFPLFIVHYTSAYKPWVCDRIPLGDRFFQYVPGTPFARTFRVPRRLDPNQHVSIGTRLRELYRIWQRTGWVGLKERLHARRKRPVAHDVPSPEDLAAAKARNFPG